MLFFICIRSCLFYFLCFPIYNDEYPEHDEKDVCQLNQRLYYSKQLLFTKTLEKKRFIVAR